MANPKMNMRGPNGGAAARNGTKLSGMTSRSANLPAGGHKLLGDTTKVASNYGGQKPQSRQAAVNSGPMTKYNVSGQKLGPTRRPSPRAGQYTSQQGGQPRGSQNTMRGTGPKNG